MSRLIDADAFKEYMRKALEETRGCYPDKGEWAEAITEQFCKDIDDQPTIEPEQKKGTWLVHLYKLGRDRYECDQCQGRCDMGYRYCPNCGADMQGDSE